MVAPVFLLCHHFGICADRHPVLNPGTSGTLTEGIGDRHTGAS